MTALDDVYYFHRNQDDTIRKYKSQRDSTVLKREWLQESTFFLAVHDASLGLQVLILCV